MVRDGYIDFRGYRTWYRVAGDLASPRAPLLCVHGGPGGTSDLFEPLLDLATTGRPVVVYDQLGSGRSDRPDDPSLWTMATFVDELESVRTTLGLEQVHLLGHSWGGMLALEYLLNQPSGVRSLVLASSLPSTKLWCDEAQLLRTDMPRHVVDAMRRCEATNREPKRKPSKAMDDATIRRRGAMTARLLPIVMSEPVGWVASLLSRVPPLRAAAYELLGAQFLKRFGSRAVPVPVQLGRMVAGMNRNVYNHLWGPSEFHATGTLADWDVTSRLGEIDVPTLLIAGRYDESTPAVNDVFEKGIPDTRRVTLGSSAHCGPVEEPQAFRDALTTFLDHVEAQFS
jgi:pimeloyl-ACP methyl ester carboxylesterase